MKFFHGSDLLSLGFCLVLGSASAQNAKKTSPAAALAQSKVEIRTSFGKIPLGFEPNRGQTSNVVQWLAHGPEYAIFLSGHDAVLQLNQSTSPRLGEDPKISSSALRMNLLGARDAFATTGEEAMAGTANYFTGKDESKWQREVPTFGKVRLSGVYPGIDLVYYGRQGRLEYDFVVAPGADTSTIRLGFEGAKARLAENGDLLLPVDGTKTEVRFDKPLVYQLKDGVREPVEGAFQIAKEDRQVSFKLGAYDKSRELVIDPTLLFTGVIATGNQQTVPTSMTVDAAGEMFLTGYTNDLTFPVTTGAYQTMCSSPTDMFVIQGGTRCGPSSAPSAFVTKISADGTTLIYSTYLHGGAGVEQGQSIVVDAAGNAYVLGATSSNDFPITADAYQTLCQPTYSQGAYFAPVPPITSQCDNFHDGGGTEYTVNGPNLFIAKLNPAGTALLYSTFFGGSAAVYPVGIGLDSANNIYFAAALNPAFSSGNVYPNNPNINYPTTATAYQTSGVDLQTSAVSELSADGHTLLYSTIIGQDNTNASPSSYPQAFSVGQNGIAYIGGFTQASGFPTTAGSIKPACGLASNNALYCATNQAFVAAVDTTKSGTASLKYSTFLGSDGLQTTNIPGQEIYGLLADSSNNLLVTGYTDFSDFPTTMGVYQPAKVTGNGSQTAFLTKINPAGNAIVWSTFLDGETSSGSAGSTGNAIALDTKGQVYLEGLSQDGGGDFPEVNPLVAYSSGNKIFIATFSPDATQLLFSTRFSGTNTNTVSAMPIDNGIAVDPAGNVYFAGYTNDGGGYGTTPGTYATAATNGFNRAFFGKISTVLPTATTTTLSTSTGAALTGSSVTLTAVVGDTADTTSIPTGSVTFTDNGNFLVTVQLASGSTTATYTTSSLPTGANEIQAIYNGDSLFATSSSSIQNVQIDATVIQAAVSLEVSSANVVAGQPETLTALVAGEYTPPTGTVTFSDQNGALGTVATSGSGSGSSAMLTLSSLAVGSHTVTAAYSGDATYTAATSSPQTVNVSSASSGTSLIITPASTTYETPVTFRASTAAHSGQILFCDVSAPQCSLNFNLAVGQVNSDGNASVVLPAGTIGTHSFIAAYLGVGPRGDSAAVPASTSAPVTVTVTGMYPSTTTVTATGGASPYLLTGNVVGIGSRVVSPTGQVTFNDTSNTASPLLGTANLGQGTLAFSAMQPVGSPVSVGANPYGVATGDFNGDGFMDVVTENYEGGSVSVLLGNGDGTFKAAVNYAVGSLPERVLVADFDGDGFLDLVVANTGSSSVSVLLGNGDGTFQTQVTYNAGSPVGLGILDLNHDGFPDIAAGDYYDGTMSVLINNGDGTFQNAVTYPTSSTPQTLAEGDFNGDGKTDIVVGNLNSANVGVFLGNGDGTFQAQVTYPVGNAPQGVQVGDFNGDGKADLAVVNSSDNTVSVLLGNGDGTFQTQITYPVGSDPVGLVVADFNGDGRQDIAVGNTTQSDLTESILLGNGDGTFQPQIKLPVANFPYGEAVADFNGDGYPDLAISAFSNNQTTILLSQVTETATATLHADLNGTGTHNLDAVYAGDANFKGSTSPVFPFTSTGLTLPATTTTLTASPTTQSVGGSVGFSVSVAGVTQTSPAPTGTVTLTNRSVTPNVTVGTITLGVSGTGTLLTTMLPAGANSIVATYSGDSVYASSTSSPQTVTITGATASTTTLTITPATTSYRTPVTLSASNSAARNGQVIFCDASAPQCSVTSRLAIAQINADGNASVKLTVGTIGVHSILARFLGIAANDSGAGIASSTSASVTVMVTGDYPTTTTVNATGTASPFTVTGTVIGLGPRTAAPSGPVTFNDISNTSSPVLGSANLGAGSLAFAAIQPAGSPVNVGKQPYGIANGDFNGDGFPDVVTASYGDGTITVQLGNGDGTFHPATSYAAGSAPAGVLAADFNGDGNLDLVVADNEGAVNVLFGNGNGTFQTFVSYPVRNPSGISILDLNHDGFPDIAASDAGAGTISVLINNGDGTFAAAVTYPTGSLPESLAEADFNGDGNIDIVVGNKNSSNVGVFLGNGDGTFQAQVTYAAGNSPEGVQAGDFNGDGKADLAVVNLTDNTVSILLGNGDGTFQTQVTYPVGSGPFGLVLADFNGDGEQDIAVADSAENSVSYLFGNGDGSFQPQIKVPAGGFPYGVSIADFNGDGFPDLAVSDVSGNQASILVSQITETATATLTNAAITGAGTHTLDAAYPGDSTFIGSTSPLETVTITAIAQSISFAAIPNHTVGDAPFTLNATASSGLAVTYTVTSGPATVSGNTVTLTGAPGTVTIQASQAGNASYAPAQAVSQSFNVAASAAVALTGVSPNSGAIGSPATTVTLTGANFSTADVVEFNSTVLASTFVNATTISAVIPASLFTTAGTGAITVHDTQTQVTSSAVTFTVSTSPQIVFTGPASAVSAQQPALTFQLVNPYPVALAGSLTLTFTSSTTSGINDPEVQFASGGRTLDFSIPADSTATPGVQLQTGTVAGTATVSLAVSANGVNVTPTNVAPVTISIPPAAPTITSSSMTRAGNTVTVSVVGFSNTREAVQATFHFNAVTGATLDNPDVKLTVGSDFSGWYVTPGSDAYGSAFTYNQVFTLDQDAAIVQNVTVTLANTVGSSSPSTTP